MKFDLPGLVPTSRAGDSAGLNRVTSMRFTLSAASFTQSEATHETPPIHSRIALPENSRRDGVTCSDRRGYHRRHRPQQGEAR
jgi:hypothetical protein